MLDLGRIEGTPSYVLLLYLAKNKDQLYLEEEHFYDIVNFLVRFFVRRNLTDRPGTDALTPLFMKIIDGIDGLASDDAVEKIKRELVTVSSSDKEFREYLERPIYSERSNMDRFILCNIEAKYWPKNEPIYDLWKKSNGKYVWTIEHIFPQGKKIPPSWTDMIAGGDEARAKDLQAQYVDCLGNLSLTGYNSNLGNMNFKDKRDRLDDEGRFIGYKNQLHLNDDIRNRDKWTIDDIIDRTTRLADEAIKLFSLNDGNKHIEERPIEKRPNPMDRFFVDSEAITVIRRGN